MLGALAFDHLMAMLAFGFAMSATPGPNTMMLLASGVNHGFRPSIPHMFGILFGLATMLVAVGLGLGALLMSAPLALTTLKIAGIAYMLWLAWRIATSAPPTRSSSADQAATGKPLSIIEAALFQWVNPKAWAMALTGVATYTLPNAYAASLTAFIAILLGLSLPVTAAWTGLGVGLRRFLDRPVALKLFNWTMAALLVASLWPIVRDWL